jgi:hypothetical protein
LPVAYDTRKQSCSRRTVVDKFMKVLTALTLLLVIGSLGCNPQKTKSQLLDEIIEAQGLRQYSEQMKAASTANAKETARMSYEQIKQRYPTLQKETLEKIRLATDKYTETVMAAWSVQDSNMFGKLFFAMRSKSDK